MLRGSTSAWEAKSKQVFRDEDSQELVDDGDNRSCTRAA